MQPTSILQWRDMAILTRFCSREHSVPMNEKSIPEKYRDNPSTERAWRQGYEDSYAVANGTAALVVRLWPSKWLILAVAFGLLFGLAKWMTWNSLILIGIGVMLGYGLFRSQAGNRKQLAIKGEAMRMQAAGLHSLSEQMSKLASAIQDRESESPEEEMFSFGQAKAFETVATELKSMADRQSGAANL